MVSTHVRTAVVDMVGLSCDGSTQVDSTVPSHPCQKDTSEDEEGRRKRGIELWTVRRTMISHVLLLLVSSDVGHGGLVGNYCFDYLTCALGGTYVV